MIPAHQSIRGEEAVWGEDILALWQECVVPHILEKYPEATGVSRANYFTPRPYRNEYDQGSSYEGFTYTVIPGPHVCISQRKVGA